MRSCAAWRWSSPSPRPLPYVAAPVTNLVSRRIEAAADLHALQRTGDVAAFERMQHDLATSNLTRLRSAWWQTMLFETHPAPAWRIAMADAWARGAGATALGSSP